MIPFAKMAIPCVTSAVGAFCCKYGRKNAQKRGFACHTCKNKPREPHFLQLWPYHRASNQLISQYSVNSL